MTADDLSAPLGQRKRKRRRTLPITDRRRSLPRRWRFLSASSSCGRSSATIRLAANRWSPCRSICMSPCDKEAGRLRAEAAARAGAPRDQPGHEARQGCRRSGRIADQRPGPAANTKTVTIIDGKTGARQDVVIPAGRHAGCAERRRAPRRRSAIRRVDDARPDPENRRRRRTAGRGFRPSGEAAARQAGRAARRADRRRSRRQRQRHRRSHHQAAGRRDARFHALQLRRRTGGRRAPAAPVTRSCCNCRWSRSIIPTTIPARRRC